jgi:hypothetical protein
MKVSQILAVCCCPLFLLGGCGLPPTGYNRAQRELNAILPKLDGVHPKTLCHDGYGANGIDSPDSLADVWLTVDAGPDLDDTVRSAAAAERFPLSTDKEVIDDLKGGAPGGWIGFRQVGMGEKYQPTSTYLTSPQVYTPFPAKNRYGERLRVIVTRAEPVSLVCGQATMLPRTYAPAGRAVLELSMTAAN